MSRRNWDLIALSAVVAFCGMIYELILAQSMAAIWGGTLARYQFTIGLYLAAMGGGAALATLPAFRRRPWASLWSIELALSLAGGATPLICLLLGQWESGGAWAYAPWIILVGALGGAELPLLIEIARSRDPDTANAATARILAFDYVGMLLAAAAFVMLLLPRLGLFGTGWLAGSLNAVAAAFTVLLAKRSGSSGKSVAPLGATRWALGLTLLVLLLQSEALRQTPRLQALLIERTYLQ